MELKLTKMVLKDKGECGSERDMFIENSLVILN